MTKDRRKYNPSFKAKVAIEAIREQDTVSTIAQKHKVNRNLVFKWKQELLAKVERVFDRGENNHRDGSEREAELLKKIGELTVERDFLAHGLGRYR